MIFLVSFKAHDEYDTCYEVDGIDALRLASLAGHPVPEHVKVTAIVTFFHEGLTNATLDENFKRARDDRDAFAETGDLFKDS